MDGMPDLHAFAHPAMTAGRDKHPALGIYNEKMQLFALSALLASLLAGCSGGGGAPPPPPARIP